MSQPPMIAIIDDDESVRIATESLVRSLGLGTNTFASAEEFLSSSALGETSCLITDIQMPGMTGLELLTYLMEHGKKLPVIFITAFPEERVRRQALAAGAIGFLGKPFGSDAIIECIDRALQGGESSI